MSEYKVSGNDLSAIADAIRTKGQTSSSLSFPDGFVDAIDAISTGGGATLITKSITTNGTYNASADSADGYSSVNVAVTLPSVVTGTFTAQETDKGSSIDITLPYSGNGYPIACMVFPSDGGFNSIASLAQKFVTIVWVGVKTDISLIPDYSSNELKNYTDGAAYITDTMCENLLRMRGAYNEAVREAFNTLR
jgi:hypothetical protein